MWSHLIAAEALALFLLLLALALTVFLRVWPAVHAAVRCVLLLVFGAATDGCVVAFRRCRINREIRGKQSERSRCNLLDPDLLRHGYRFPRSRPRLSLLASPSRCLLYSRSSRSRFHYCCETNLEKNTRNNSKRLIWGLYFITLRSSFVDLFFTLLRVVWALTGGGPTGGVFLFTASLLFLLLLFLTRSTTGLTAALNRLIGTLQRIKSTLKLRQEKLKRGIIHTVKCGKTTSSRTFSLSSASCSDMSKPHLFLRRFLRFCLFFSSFSSLARSSSDSSSTNCSSRLMPCIFSTAIWGQTHTQRVKAKKKKKKRAFD